MGLFGVLLPFDNVEVPARTQMAPPEQVLYGLRYAAILPHVQICGLCIWKERGVNREREHEESGEGLKDWNEFLSQVVPDEFSAVRAECAFAPLLGDLEPVSVFVDRVCYTISDMFK